MTILFIKLTYVKPLLSVCWKVSHWTANTVWLVAVFSNLEYSCCIHTSIHYSPSIVPIWGREESDIYEPYINLSLYPPYLYPNQVYLEELPVTLVDVASLTSFNVTVNDHLGHLYCLPPPTKLDSSLSSLAISSSISESQSDCFSRPNEEDNSRVEMYWGRKVNLIEQNRILQWL